MTRAAVRICRRSSVEPGTLAHSSAWSYGEHPCKGRRRAYQATARHVQLFRGEWVRGRQLTLLPNSLSWFASAMELVSAPMSSATSAGESRTVARQVLSSQMDRIVLPVSG